MPMQRNGYTLPDGFSLSFVPSSPGLKLGVGGTYYWHPGSPTAPPVTLTGTLGAGPEVMSLGPGLGAHLVYLRNGMTSADTLGYGTTSNVSTMIPSVAVNTSIPDVYGIPQPLKNKVSSIEAGADTSIGASAAGTYTATPQHVVDFVNSYISPAGGRGDELDPAFRNLRWGSATVGQPEQPPAPYLNSRILNMQGEPITPWRLPADISEPAYGEPPAVSPRQPRGLLGMLKDYVRDNPDQFPQGW